MEPNPLANHRSRPRGKLPVEHAAAPNVKGGGTVPIDRMNVRRVVLRAKKVHANNDSKKRARTGIRYSLLRQTQYITVS